MRDVPMAVVPQDEESGLGLCLRTIARNHLSLNWVRRELCLNPKRMPHDSQLAALACVLAADEQFLAARMVRQESAGSQRWLCGAHRGFLASHVRVARPQVCAQCVHRTGHCGWAWDFALTTACPVHNCILIDACAACGAPLRWDRPDVHLCRCRRPIRTFQEEAGEPQRIFSMLAGSVLHNQSIAYLLAPVRLPEFLGGLSLAGLTMVVQAFGDLPRPLVASHASICVKAQPTAYWRAVQERALDRLRVWRSGHVCDDQINFAILRRLARESACAADRSVAISLLKRAGHPATDQLELFA